LSLLTGGAKDAATRQAAVDFMLFMRSAAVQKALQTTMWMWPASATVAREPVMTFAGKAPTARAVDAAVLDRDARNWVRRFNQEVVR
jgi:thiamine transport system substrate-binding protein